VVSRGLSVHNLAFLPISARKTSASSARAPSVSTATRQKTWLNDRLMHLAVFLSDAAVAALPACSNKQHKYSDVGYFEGYVTEMEQDTASGTFNN